MNSGDISNVINLRGINSYLDLGSGANKLYFNGSGNFLSSGNARYGSENGNVIIRTSGSLDALTLATAGTAIFGANVDIAGNDIVNVNTITSSTGTELKLKSADEAYPSLEVGSSGTVLIKNSTDDTSVATIDSSDFHIDTDDIELKTNTFNVYMSNTTVNPFNITGVDNGAELRNVFRLNSAANQGIFSLGQTAVSFTCQTGTVAFRTVSQQPIIFRAGSAADTFRVSPTTIETIVPLDMSGNDITEVNKLENSNGSFLDLSTSGLRLKFSGGGRIQSFGNLTVRSTNGNLTMGTSGNATALQLFSTGVAGFSAGASFYDERVYGIRDPEADDEAANKAYVDSKTVYAVIETAASAYTITDWGKTIVIDNTDLTNTIITLPAISASTVGFEIKLWIKNSADTNPVQVECNATTDILNDQASVGGNVAKASYTSPSNHLHVSIQCIGTNDIYINSPDSVFT